MSLDVVEHLVARYCGGDVEELAELLEVGVQVPPPPETVTQVRIDPTDDPAVWFFTVGDGRSHRVEVRDGRVVAWA